ncbi:hypothetical protein N7510_003340 [Penicillium lagena]|uniref:uncharacterized protein n=1 Tax=Penicillium lagena TaxID=94218 RepID=UPI002541448B|nr:uncharacterized protein N7510_003340 [Penicillium lagena]KAJ5619356.1 hypothetical protein N7510_003340 [Penicillium lagena]
MILHLWSRYWAYAPAAQGAIHSESIQERVIGSGGSAMAVRGRQCACRFATARRSLKIIRRCIDLFTSKIVDAASFSKQASPPTAAIQERPSLLLAARAESREALGSLSQELRPRLGLIQSIAVHDPLFHSGAERNGGLWTGHDWHRSVIDAGCHRLDPLVSAVLPNLVCGLVAPKASPVRSSEQFSGLYELRSSAVCTLGRNFPGPLSLPCGAHIDPTNYNLKEKSSVEKRQIDIRLAASKQWKNALAYAHLRID